VEFTIAGAVVIILLAILGILFLPRREELRQEEKVHPLYPDERDRRGVRGVGRERRSGGERNASRPSEGAGELRRDREVGVQRDPLDPPDP
jgi:hypothetical protein